MLLFLNILSTLFCVCSGPAVVSPDGSYQEGQGLILLDEVLCQGSESSLVSCSHSGWGQHDCSHSEDVGVRCSREAGNQTRLSDPSGEFQQGDLRKSSREIDKAEFNEASIRW